jgi:hypothetical protein
MYTVWATDSIIKYTINKYETSSFWYFAAFIIHNNMMSVQISGMGAVLVPFSVGVWGFVFGGVHLLLKYCLGKWKIMRQLCEIL